MKAHIIIILILGWMKISAAKILETPFLPLPTKPSAPKDNPITPAKVELGKQLYFDPRLSKDGTVSCNSCHNVMSNGTDNRAVSAGINGQLGGRSAPTVWNSGLHSVQFWDGRAATLEDQAKGPLTNPIEMGMPSHEAVIDRIKKIPGYVSQFEKVFGKGGVTIDNLAKAIATYERTLVTPDSPLDRYLKGNEKALSAQQVRGMKTVMEVGCVACHTGINLNGANLEPGVGNYQKFPTFTENEYVKKYEFLKDKGRSNVTKDEGDDHFWRVPTWRNVALTAPYFHNGAVKTLPEAVRVMAKVQLNKDLTEEQVADIVEFLKATTGKFPAQTLPRLPESETFSTVE